MMSSSQWTRNTKWLFEVMVQHAQQETKHFYVCACLMHVRVARPCVCVCVWMCFCMSMCSKLEKGEDWGSTFQCSTHLPGRLWCHCPWRVTVPSMFFRFLFVFLQVTSKSINREENRKNVCLHFCLIDICVFEFAWKLVWICIDGFMCACIFQ